jgi:hypothetical protein
MKCSQAKSLFSLYLDGAVTGRQMRALGEHLQSCDACAQQYESLRMTQQLLTKVGRKKPPSDLSLRLRLAISREAAQARRSRFEGLQVRLENALNAFMVPATAGLVATVLIFGALMGSLAVPLRADHADVPLMLYTAPQLQQAAFGNDLDSIHDDSLVIEAYVGSDGRVDDYRILSGSSEAQDILPKVKRMLIFTTFRPAMSMGVPTRGRAVLSFSKISVKG